MTSNSADVGAPANANTSSSSGNGGVTASVVRACSIGSLFGVPIKLHPSYFILLALALMRSIQYRSVRYSFYQFIIMGPILFITIPIHELGHIIMARKLGGEAKCIMLCSLGGLAISSQPDPATHKSFMLVAVAGPAARIVQTVFWAIFSALVGLATPASYWGTHAYYGINGNVADFFVAVGLGSLYSNLTLMCFNLLLPAYPLDGGQIFASFLLMRGNSPEKAGKITSYTAGVIALTLLIWASITYFDGQSPFAILSMLVAFWILNSSYNLHKLVMAGRVRDRPLFNTTDSRVSATEETNEIAEDKHRGLISTRLF
jgi:Zn-dependent protease